MCPTVGHILEQNVGESLLCLVQTREFLERTKDDIQRDYLKSELGDGFVSSEVQLVFTIAIGCLPGDSYLDITDHYWGLPITTIPFTSTFERDTRFHLL